MIVTLWVLGDQLLPEHPAVRVVKEQMVKERLMVLMIESEARARRLPYQRKKE
jgi:deoxyribodipyrimidine photolyase-like uncharacterized protein